VPPYPGLNCAMGMLQTSVRHSYLRSEVGVLSRFPVERINALFDGLVQKALTEAEEEGFAPTAVSLTRLIDLRYPHQGYTLAVACPERVNESDKPRLKQAFDELHRQVYGQFAPQEDAEIVTFRLQAEIEVPRLTLPDLSEGDGDVSRALKGERKLFDAEGNDFQLAKVYDRVKLMAGDRIAGPAIIDQFDSTTVMLDGQTVTVDRTGTLIIEDTKLRDNAPR
jgi:N-methylhydantoinase A